jgi:8-oxo-dGTP diphosphatase
MEKYQEEAQNFYGNRIRIRVCGICFSADKILMIGHKGIINEGIFWSPPGGGVNENETLTEALQREFLEETGLSIKVDKFLLMNEFINQPLQALEVFFSVNILAGNLKKGYDPEMPTQIIEKIAWMSLSEIKKLPDTARHSFWDKIMLIEDLLANYKSLNLVNQ